MDPLDQLAGPAADLLARVDDVLARAGAPDGHPIWRLLRRLRALPGDAVGAITTLRPASLAAAGSAMRALLPEYDDAYATLSDRPPWQGAGAEAFDAHRVALAEHLGGGADSLTGRLATTASYLDDLAAWAAQSRETLARALAEVLGSAEAVLVVAGDSAGEARVRAAADLAAMVLAVVEESVDRAETLLSQWMPSLVELPYRTPAPDPVRPDRATRLAY